MAAFARLYRAVRGRQALGDISNQGSSNLTDKAKEDAAKPTKVLPPSASVSVPAPSSSLPPAPPAPPAPPTLAQSDSHKGKDVPVSSLFAEMESSLMAPEMDNSIDQDDLHFEALADELISPEEKEEDADDPLSEYYSNIMAYLRKTETRRMPSPNYMAKQADVNSRMREIVIDWLVEVHLKFKLRLETLYLTVNIFDRFLERRAVKRSRLQLLGCTAMLIAAKYEEIWAPKVKNFVVISDNAYTKDQIIAMEAILLNTLNFNLTHASPLQFARRYLKAAGGSNSTSATTLEAGGNQELEMLTLYLMELTLQSYAFLQYRPSMIAASALYLAMQSLSLSAWDAKMAQLTQYSETEMQPCVRDLVALANVPSPKYRAVRKKYATPKLLEVSKMRIWVPPVEASPAVSS